MSNEYFTVFIDEKTVADINASARNALSVPTEEQNDTLYIKSDTEKKWRELLEIRDTKVALSEDKEDTIYTVQYRVSNDGYEQPNRGRVFTLSYWVSNAGLNNPGHESHKKAKMNMVKVVSLLKACGVTMVKNEDGKYPFHEYFNAMNGEKVLVGKSFWGIIRDYQYISRKDNALTPGQDVDKFIKLDS